uniref:Uncharacterized protein n=1 Tax=Pseudo-nitzschia delicatissima TaxID=44447 RepID=A0A7S0T8G9_9STRA|mmetsp:Transcript_1406/g.3237  ORF Transcript_1406/g.3237 Transcript_1406/m.3237 type:complete len:159 (+) Transcript_1406:157-633(+)|eukprot:CAMPEP_0116102496 /NCGR_PEP_ID=MMETSP0327-20121206/13381_1 /TAXON_ID=44447 /ORGANISM="Pseudo-nitzschia delicatissima, Strain B596" /LENGTH=158 /DNA_ID=CAMNT_0003594541 /DNA_START=58 /DNA_END=534 /DNA_ORIENTATION=-
MSSNAFKKLSPEVRRELLRHVKPSSNGSQKTKQAAQRLEESQQARNAKTKRWLLGCVGFVGCAATLPYYVTQKIGNLTARDDPLTAAQVRRGAFMNSGSRDAGKDTNWDLKNGQYVYPKGFAEHLKMQNPEETDFGPDIGPIVQNERKQQKLKQQQQQ